MQLAVLAVARAASFLDFHVSSLKCYFTEKTAKIRTRSSLKKRTWYKMLEIVRMPLEQKQRQTHRIEKGRGGLRSLLAQLWASAITCLPWFTTTKQLQREARHVPSKTSKKKRICHNRLEVQTNMFMTITPWWIIMTCEAHQAQLLEPFRLIPRVSPANIISIGIGVVMLPTTGLWQSLETHMTANLTRSTNPSLRADNDVEKNLIYKHLFSCF